MKLMLFAIFVALVAIVRGEESLNRDKRFATAGAFAGPFFGWGGWPFAGAYAGPYGYGPAYPYRNAPQAPVAQASSASDSYSSSQYSPYYPRAGIFPFPFYPFPMPWPQMPKAWYEGDNVCKIVKVDNSTDQEFSDFLSDSGFSDPDFNSEYEQCKGSDTRFVCVKKINQNGQVRREATKYFCCYGFVRNPYGPGCIENKGQVQPDPNAGDRVYYNIDSGRSSSSSMSSSSFSSRPNVDKVAPQ